MAPSVDQASAAPAANSPSSLDDVSKVKSALLSAAHSTPRSGSHTPIDHIIANTAGYTDTVFEGKADQAAQVKKLLSSKGFIRPDLVDAEVDWFYQ